MYTCMCIYIYIYVYIDYIYVYIDYIYVHVCIYRLKPTVFINTYLQDGMTSNSFWKIMTKFKFMCDVAAIELVKLEIKKQRCSLLYS